jgi:hypothetical protein
VSDRSERRPLDTIDVRGVAEALDDGDRETTWWYDPATGEVEPGVADWMADSLDDDDDDDPDERGLVRIESHGSRPAYDDMVMFAAAVGDRRAADLLERALEGRGAFRRFRDTIHEFEHLVGPWQAYANARAELRAISWLVGNGQVDLADGEAVAATCRATAAAVLALVGEARGLRLDVTELAARWGDVEAAIDAGHDVTLLRDGDPWATITPA